MTRDEWEALKPGDRVYDERRVTPSLEGRPGVEGEELTSVSDLERATGYRRFRWQRDGASLHRSGAVAIGRWQLRQAEDVAARQRMEADAERRAGRLRAVPSAELRVPSGEQP